MKEIYIATKLEEPEHRVFAVQAAQQGLSKSALLKKIAREFIAASAAQSASANTQPEAVPA